jgi:hypothetical protein
MLPSAFFHRFPGSAGASPAIAAVWFEASGVRFLAGRHLIWITVGLDFPLPLRRWHQFCRFSVRDRQSDFKSIADRHSHRERSYERVSGAVSACDGDPYARQFQYAAGPAETPHAVAARGGYA